MAMSGGGSGDGSREPETATVHKCVFGCGAKVGGPKQVCQNCSNTQGVYGDFVVSTLQAAAK
jgi:hypothetical protein